MRKIISLLLAVLMAASLTPTVFSASVSEFSDMPKETYWSYGALASAVENGLLNGSDGLLKPRANLTRAQMAAIVNRAFGATESADISAFSDVGTKDWFYADVAKAVRMGTFNGSGNGKMNPNAPISREQAFTVVARALKLPDGDAGVLGRFSDGSSVSSWARGPVAAMAAGGYVNGSGGKLNPSNTITREEFAQVFLNVIKRYVRTPGEATGDTEGNVIVNVPGVTLHNMKIDGDLILGEGVGNGEVILDAVEITGRLVVRGGGENSVIIRNSSTVGSVVIGKTGDGGVRVRTEEGARVEVVVVDDGEDRVILEGDLNQIRIDTDVTVVIRDANVTGLTVTAPDADVSVEGDSAVAAVRIAEAAENASLSVGEGSSVSILTAEAFGTTVSGGGSVTEASVSGDGTTIDTSGTLLSVAVGTAGVTENGNTVGGGQTVVTGGEPPHVHVWDDGVVTSEPTCEKAGVRTFTCGCGETRTEEIPALGHDWDEGVFTVEPTPDADGVITFTCLRCGATRDEAVAYTPFIIFEDGEAFFFTDLDEALAKAHEYVHHNDPGEPDWTEYAIVFVDSVALRDVTVPDGHTLIVIGNVSIDGTLTLGSSDYATCPGAGASRIMVEMTENSSLTLDGVKIWDGADPEAGLIRANGESEDGGEMLSICGMRAVDKAEDPGNGSVYGRPWLCLEAFGEGGHVYEIGDLDVTRWFDGFLVEGSAGVVRISGDFRTDECVVWDGAEILLGGEGASFTLGGEKLFGTGEDAAVRMTDDGGARAWFRYEDNTFTLTGKEAVINGSFTARNFVFEPETDDGLTVSVPAGSTLSLANARIRDGVRIVNDGALRVVDYNVEISGIIENNGVFVAVAGDGVESWDGVSRAEFREGELVNRGVVRIEEVKNGDWWEDLAGIEFFDSTLTNEEGGVIENEGDLNLNGGTFVNRGTLANGALTNVGEGENGSRANFNASSAKIVNSSKIVNNGNMNFNQTVYSQTAEAKFETYNAAGFEIRGGSLAVPSGAEFFNEGYMKVTDRYGGDGYVCDLGGFEDFFTVWNTDGNDSHWCDFTAEVADLDGYRAAVSAQLSRADSLKYNRMDFRGDVTFEEDVTFMEFRDYWVMPTWIEEWVRVEDGVEVSYPGWVEDADNRSHFRETTLTVGEDATLTVGGKSTLIVTGEDNGWGVASSMLKVDGTLVTAASVPGYDEGDVYVDGVPEGRIEIWSDGSFDAEGGEVVNNGYFEVRYMEDGDGNGGYAGTFSRPDYTVLKGVPDDAVLGAEVRSEAGFRNALSSDPVFGRILVRWDRTIELGGDVTVPSGTEVFIEGSSGLIIPHGATFTLSEGSRLNNSGDITVWGDAVVRGEFNNWQHLEIGAATGSETAVLTVYGYLHSSDTITVYPTGSIVIADGQLDNHGEPVRAVYVSGRIIEGAVFDGPVTVRDGENGEIDVRFSRCSFGGDVTMEITLDGAEHRLELRDCDFADGAVVRAVTEGEIGDGDYDAAISVSNGENSVWIAPHIFCLGDNPGVFIGVCDENISFNLTLGGEPLPFDADLIGGERKTHLMRTEHGDWFTANRGDAPDLGLTVSVPGFPTVSFDRVPVKPEWLYADGSSRPAPRSVPTLN